MHVEAVHLIALRRAHSSEVCTLRYTTRSVPADVVARLNAGAARFRRHRGVGLSPSTEGHSASQATHQAASQSGRAGRRNRSRSYAGHLHHGTAGAVARASATRQLVALLSVEVRVRRAAARRLLPTRDFSAGRVGGTARLGSHMPAPPALPWCRMSPCRAAARLSVTFSRRV